ncbi:sodium channel protein Nach [Anopheles aquasalis]|uniref:sodium channel protein Nach n=1 Tax=Anopheles aquasalis TaxID=42839 RepID=UPI00215B7560|nr:sodium channel protein Nach [Anopheles aquasalis]
MEHKLLSRIVSRTKRFIVSFLSSVSAHGVRHLVHGGVHIVERMIWISCISIGVYGMVALSQRIWNRFQTSPTVISMDRNMFLWNTSFPSLTVCSLHRIDEEKLERYIQERDFDEDDAEQFREFIVLLANVTYSTFLELPMYKTFGIAGYDYMELLYNLSWNFQPTVNSGTTRTLSVQPTVTELGLCLAVNSRIGEYTSYEYWRAKRWDRVNEPEPLVVHPLDGEVYGQLIKLENSYEVFFHGSMEVAEISKRHYSFPESYYTTVELHALEILTSPNARELSVSQRQCRFTHEGDTLVFSPVYSYNLCRIECRMKLAYKLCGCVPHFYRPVGKRKFRYRICDFEGLRCLGQRADEMITLRSKGVDIECGCLPNCDDSNFFIQAHRSREWFLGANLQWGLTDYPKMQLKRDIIFGLSDVFVYIGGLGGFFLGCSLLTFAEFVFFLTWRLCKLYMEV